MRKIETGDKLEAFTQDSFSGWWAIREVESEDEIGSGDGGLYEEDAKLFAAAPDMLAALKVCANYEIP